MGKNLKYKNIIKEIAKKNIAVLAGAGISRDSGLPIVKEFYEEFLPIFYEKIDQAKLKETITKYIPFERLMEHIFSYTNNDYSIMNIFANGQPNSIHYILARMMHKGWISDLYTTNFDRLLESALEIAEGLIKKDYGYFCTEEDFSKLQKHAKSHNVIKIHGTIDNEKSIRTTLETITSNNRLNRRRPPIERLLNSGSHDIVLVLGYSFSDEFDINKFIKEMDIAKKVVIINHSNEPMNNSSIKILSNEKYLESGKFNPFFGKNFDGVIVSTNTFSFVSECYTYACGIEFKNSETLKKCNWKEELKNWGRQYDKEQKIFIAGGICTAMDEFSLGDKYISRAYSTMEKYPLITPDRMSLYASISNHYILSKYRTKKTKSECEHLISLCNEAIKFLDKNRVLLPKEKYNKLKSDITYRLGRVFEEVYHEYDTAKQYYYLANDIESKGNNELEVSKILHQIGYIESLQGNFCLAKIFLKKSIKIKRKHGYIGGVARGYYTLAAEMIRHNSKKTARISYYLSKASECVGNSGEVDLHFYIRNLQAIILMRKSKWSDAEWILNSNLSELGKSSRGTAFITANFNLARCEIRLQKYKSAINRLKNGLRTVIASDDRQRIFSHNQELSLAYLLSDNSKKCYAHLLENVNYLSNANQSDLGVFLYCASLFYKKHCMKNLCDAFFGASKIHFERNNAKMDFYSLKMNFENKIFPLRKPVFEESEYSLLDYLENLIL